jgi:hypothetical protein
LTDDESDFLRLAFDESGGAPGKFMPLIEVPSAAIDLANKGLVLLLPMSAGTWRVALSASGAGEAQTRSCSRKGAAGCPPGRCLRGRPTQRNSSQMIMPSGMAMPARAGHR